MPRPGDLTPEQAAAEARRLRERWREADRIAAPLFAETDALSNATEADLERLPLDEASAADVYRAAYAQDMAND